MFAGFEGEGGAVSGFEADGDLGAEFKGDPVAVGVLGREGGGGALGDAALAGDFEFAGGAGFGSDGFAGAASDLGDIVEYDQGGG